MRAYYFDDLPGDQRLPHDCVPSRPVSLESLKSLGVSYWSIPVEGYESQVDAVAQERECNKRDTVNVSKVGLGDIYEEKIKGFFQEHMHEDEEVRYILSGSGYFDIHEAPTDAWIRLAVEPGDLIVIPAGLYHRFTSDEENDIKALHLFKDEPKWVRHVRRADTDINPHRIKYLKSIGVGA